MKEKKESPVNEKETLSLTIYKPEEEILQKMPLCKYLSELPDVTEEETKDLGLEKKEQHLPLK
jgi:hypothetical protein